ncbi:MAG: DUF2752 domain-containing protein [Aeromicrobium sp.]
MTTATTAPRRVQLLRSPALVGTAGLAAGATLHLRDPHASGSYGFCPFLVLTGHPCPGCGGLRAVNDLTHGDVVAAISSNLFAVALVAALTLAWTTWVVRRARGVDAPMVVLTDRGLLLVLGVALAFGVLRNTPWGAWLAP